MKNSEKLIQPPGNNAALDTNVVIQVFNGIVLPFVQDLRKIYIPFPVLGELQYGALNSDQSGENFDRTVELMEDSDLLLATEETILAYASIRFELKKIGKPIPDNDLWIAAVCVELGIRLVTEDRHFHIVPGLVALHGDGSRWEDDPSHIE